ncbi:MAG: hypothetical protein U0354_16475 [Candidatus Sericytochromatia bacterium]
MSLNDNNISEDTTYHCYDCGGIWSIDGVDIYTTKDSIKYVCKECRGRCLPKNDLKKIIGVKSIKQKHRNSRIGLYIIIGLVLLGFYKFYDRRVTVTDYKNYLVDTATIRKSINSNLITFRDDNKLLESYKSKNKDSKFFDAQSRIDKAKRYIYSKNDEISKIDKPDKEEIIELYELETGFWKNPTYINYLKYQGSFSYLKKKYGNDYFEKFVNTVRKQIEKNRKKTNKVVFLF